MGERDRADGTRGAAALRRILEVARELSAPLELREMLSRVIDAGRDVLEAERGTVFLHDAAARELYALAATGLSEFRFGVDKGIAGETARTRRVVNVPDCYADPRFNREADRATGYRTRSVLCVPIRDLDGRVFAVAQALNKQDGGAFDAADLRRFREWMASLGVLLESWWRMSGRAAQL